MNNIKFVGIDFVGIEVLEEGPPRAIISVDGVEVSVECKYTLVDGRYHIHPLEEQRDYLFDRAVQFLRTN